jgi:hypothetical protein
MPQSAKPPDVLPLANHQIGTALNHFPSSLD